MTEIQRKITDYVAGREYPSRSTLRAFVGMLETGEATTDDFHSVGGMHLVSQVLQAESEGWS